MTIRIDTRTAGMLLVQFIEGDHFAVDPRSGCWLWLRAKDQHGYGCVRLKTDSGRRNFKAHRLSWQAANGPIPEGLEMDHLCRTPSCINPSHLEPVTHAENMRRSDTPAARNLLKTHCKRGHPFDDQNTMWVKGGRRCRTCERDRIRAAQQANREKKRRQDRESWARHKDTTNARRRAKAAEKRSVAS